MNRELDGCYFRIVRDGVGQSVCFTDLTKEERDILLAEKDTQFLKKLCYGIHLAILMFSYVIIVLLILFRKN